MSLVISVLVVLLCLAGTATFVCWYLGSGSNSQIIGVKSALAASPPLGAANQPQNQFGRRRGGFAAPRRFGRRPMMQIAGNVIRRPWGWQITAGSYLLYVSPAARPDQPVRMQLRYDGYGGLAMPMPTDFVIIRRVAHDGVIAHQLSVPPDQLKSLTAMADDPAVRGDYSMLYPVLPVADADWTLLRGDWAAYQQDTQGSAAAERRLELNVAQVGDRSVGIVRAIYLALETKTHSLLTSRQIDLYYALATGRVKSAGVVAPAAPPAVRSIPPRPPTQQSGIHFGPIRPTAQPATRP